MRTNKKSLFLLSLLFYLGFAKAQQSIHLQDLLRKAEQNYPATRQKEEIKRLGLENEKILDWSFYPQLNLTGQATYQSEVTKFTVTGFPGLPSPKADNYNIGLDLRFPLTEYTLIKSKKQLEEARTNLGLYQLDIELQRIRERIANIFGNILLNTENKKILSIRISDLKAQRAKILTGVENGLVLKSNLLVFESEIMSAEQKILDIDASLIAFSRELSTLTGTLVEPSANFDIPEIKNVQSSITRPEKAAFQAQKDILSQQTEVLKKENLPKLYVFGQGAYGRPGYNFLKTDLRLYGIAGAGLNWNINNMCTEEKKVKTFDINKRIIDQQQESFDMNLKAALEQKETEIAKYDQIILKDEEIVAKRKEIIKASSSQLENGAITSTEYLTELNALNAAELNKALHKVQQAFAKIQYQILTGNQIP